MRAAMDSILYLLRTARRWRHLPRDSFPPRSTRTAAEGLDGAQGGSGGGGVSSFFALPAWQDGLQTTKTSGSTAPLTMRGVPDVCADADPETGYDVRIDGTDTVIGGTSAVAPLWAGLIARINATNGRPVGFINPTLYATPAALHDITQGDNGDFQASPGWDACTGLGSPDGAQIATLLGSAPTS